MYAIAGIAGKTLLIKITYDTKVLLLFLLRL